MYSFRESVEVGGLMAYAVNMADFVGRAAVYVDKILKGAKPADLYRAADEVRVDHQSHGCEGARYHRPAIIDAVRGRGDSVVDRRMSMPGIIVYGRATRSTDATGSEKRT